MSCKLPYLEGKPYETSARAKHAEIRTQLLEAKDTNGDQLFIRKNGFLTINSNRFPQERTAQIDFINELNTQHGKDVVTHKEIEFQNKVLDVVGVDVRPLFDEEGELTIQDYLEISDQEFKEEDKKLLNDLKIFAEADLEHEKLFTGAVKRIKELMSKYINSISRGNVDAPGKISTLKFQISQLQTTAQTPEVKDKIAELQKQLQEVEKGSQQEQDLRNQLDELDELEPTMQALSNYIIQSSQWIDQLYKDFFKKDTGARNLYRLLDEDDKRAANDPKKLGVQDREKMVKRLAKEINKSRHYLYLFKELKDLQNELQNQGLHTPTDTSVERSEKFSKRYNEILDQYELPEEMLFEIQHFIDQNESFSGAGLITLTTERVLEHLRKQGREINPELRFQVETQLQDILEEFPGTISGVLQRAINRSNKLSDSLETFHDHLLTEWLWPTLNRKQKELPREYQLTKEQFKAKIRTGDRDEGILKGWLDATIKASDPFTAMVATVISDGIYEAHQQDIETANILHKAADEAGVHENLSVEEQREYYTDMIHDILEPALNQYGQVEEAEEDYEGEVLTVNVFGENRKVKATKVKAIFQEYNEAKLDATKMLFNQNLHQQWEQLEQYIGEGFDTKEQFIGGLWSFLNQEGIHGNSYWENFRNQVFPEYKGERTLAMRFDHRWDETTQKWVGGRWFPNAVRKKLRKSLKATFFKEHYQTDKKGKVVVDKTGKWIPHDSYKLENNSFGGNSLTRYNQLKADTRKFTYYTKLNAQYNQINQLAGKKALKYGIRPQFKKTSNVVNFKGGSWLQELWEWLKTTQLATLIQNKLGLFKQDVTGEDKSIAIENQYLNNEPLKTISLQGTTRLAEEDIEQDLFRSIMGYATAVHKYRKMRDIEPMLQILKNRVSGDYTRLFKKYNAKGLQLFGSTKAEAKEKAALLNQKLIQFIDDLVYGDSEFAKEFAGYDLQKIANKMIGFTSFTSLMWNISSMPMNIGVGLIGNAGESVGGRYYSRRDNLDAAVDYLKWFKDASPVKDLQTPQIYKKSKLSQLLIFFDGLQGEFLDETGGLVSGTDMGKVVNRTMFFNMNIAEHGIQTRSMIAQMRGFKLPSGKSLWDSVLHVEGKEIRFTPECTPEQLRKFQQQLHAVNKKLHGHYAKMDKAMVQRYWLGKMAMMFHKYIYSSIKYRFGEQQIDYETGDVQEGYVRSYFDQLLTEYKGNSKFMKYFLAFGKANLRGIAGSVDQLFVGVISKNSERFRKAIYREQGTERNAAARQVMFDMMWINVLVLVSTMLHALNEDDDKATELSKWCEVVAKKLEGDLGMYMFFQATPKAEIFTTYDKLQQLVKSPLAQIRTWDSTVSLASQLFGVEYGDDGLNFTANDTYTRSGPGYEKGEYKLGRKIKKSIIAPYWQLVKLFNNDEQLQYLNLSRKNSQ